MANPNNVNEKHLDVEEQESPLQEGTVPARVRVYERPTQSRSSTALTVIVVVALLLLAAFAVYMLLI